jgi:hypothetical protein
VFDEGNRGVYDTGSKYSGRIKISFNDIFSNGKKGLMPNAISQ